MNKSNKSNKSNVVESKGPGRPAYTPTIPHKVKFTFTDLMLANGVDPKTGKGEKCTKLTLNNWKDRDFDLGNKSSIVQIKGLLAKPNSESGLGRKQFVFCKRENLAEIETKLETSKAKTPTVKAIKAKAPVSVNVGKTAKTAKTYDEVKAELLAPVAPVTVPVVDIAPVAPVTVPDATEQAAIATAEATAANVEAPVTA